jgi:hypothetical protein
MASTVIAKTPILASESTTRGLVNRSDDVFSVSWAQALRLDCAKPSPESRMVEFVITNTRYPDKSGITRLCSRTLRSKEPNKPKLDAERVLADILSKRFVSQKTP